jgi:hypothetical protein
MRNPLYPHAKGANASKRWIELGFVCYARIKTDPGAELRREERFPCMFDNIPISSISAENTVVLHRSLLNLSKLHPPPLAIASRHRRDMERRLYTSKLDPCR